MKLLHSTIVATVVVFASLTVFALEAKADDDVRSGAWNEGRAAGRACATDSSTCEFKNPYQATSSDSGEESEDPGAEKPDSEAQALKSADYIAGFIVGKSEASK